MNPPWFYHTYFTNIFLYRTFYASASNASWLSRTDKFLDLYSGPWTFESHPFLHYNLCFLFIHVEYRLIILKIFIWLFTSWAQTKSSPLGDWLRSCSLDDWRPLKYERIGLPFPSTWLPSVENFIRQIISETTGLILVKFYVYVRSIV